MAWSDEKIENACRFILSGEFHRQSIVVTLDEFRKFYKTLWTLRGDPPKVSLVNLQTIVKGQFSDVSPQHFDIISVESLLEEKFEFIHEKSWYGAEKLPQGFAAFLCEEIKLNWKRLTFVFLSSGVLLYLINAESLYELIGSYLIQSTTVFLSIYLIFTVSQSQNLYKDVSLFKSGVLHQYYNDDRNVTFLGILTIGLTFVSSIVVAWLSLIASSISASWIAIAVRAAKSLGVAVVITLLFDTFLIVANYYLERNRDIMDRDVAANILHEDYNYSSGHHDGTINHK